MAASRKKPSQPTPDASTETALAELESLATPADREALARYGIPAGRALGVAMNKIQALAKRLGRSHELADGLWRSGWYEARLLAAYVDEPAAVTIAQMDRWCGDFDNWAICDTVCFALFDRSPHAWSRVEAWAGKKPEFVKRAAFALIWGLTVHDKAAGDEPFLHALGLIASAAADERDLVKKGIDMALRAIGKRNVALNVAAVKTARRLAESADVSAAWVGRHALKELTGAAVLGRLKGK